uniref:Uncharacterized protein n=1 Tax=Romanomermis culicivorax TaxID=13658 RepID=A0A915IL44_ROMCU
MKNVNVILPLSGISGVIGNSRERQLINMFCFPLSAHNSMKTRRGTVRPIRMDYWRFGLVHRAEPEKA